MESIELQRTFFEFLKNRISGNLSPVDEIADLLNISNDSAYRRIRGEKELSLSELKTLCNHFGISVDHLLGIESGTFLFRGRLVDGQQTGIREYLTNMLTVVENARINPGVRFMLEAKDILPLHHFIIPELAAFKLFFWSKTLFREDQTQKKFRPEDYEGELVGLAEKVSSTYIHIDATEIWNTETLNSSLRQVNYLWQSGYLNGKPHALHLLERMGEMINHLEAEASAGEKFQPGSQPQGRQDNFLMYHNDVLMGHNTIMVTGNGSSQVYLNHNIINFMGTSDKTFCEYTAKTFNNLMRKSTLISVTNEKDRSRFFNHLRQVIESEMKKL